MKVINKHSIKVGLSLLALSCSSLLSAKTLDPDLANTMQLASADALHEVIISFDGQSAVSQAQLDALSAAGINTAISMRSLPIVGALATAEQINAIYARDDVVSVWENEQLSYENYDATALTGVQQLRKDSTMRIGGIPYSGRGVGVVINDSGIDGNHGDLKFPQHVVQNVAAQTNLRSWSDVAPISYLENVSNTDLGGGHGTHVAGTIGGNGAMSRGRHAGVAPGADLIGYGSGAGLFILDTIGGFDYALTNQYSYNIRVISNSFGSTSDIGNDFQPDHPTNIATKALSDNGVIVVFSAGNSGRNGEHTITGNFKKAPWVIAVGAGTKDGNLIDFSSRGLRDHGGEANVDGEVFTWEDRPTVVAPGVAIISARASTSSLQALSADEDVPLSPAELPYYTHMQGTSMAAPHVAGIVALMLEANPSLNWREVKQLLQDTATNMPGREAWEVGAGYVNAHAAVKAAAAMAEYGSVVKVNRQFNASANVVLRNKVSEQLSYLPAGDNSVEFNVGADVSVVVAQTWMDRNVGAAGETVANTLAILLIDPQGNRYRSSTGTPVLTNFVGVTAPGMAGTWTVQVVGTQDGISSSFNGVAAPDTVDVDVKQYAVENFDNLADVAGHPGQKFVEYAVAKQLIDGTSNGFMPDALVTRIELADALSLAGSLRQSTMGDTQQFNDVAVEFSGAANAAAQSGGSLKDRFFTQDPLLPASSSDNFGSHDLVNRGSLAYSMVQALGLQSDAQAFDTNSKVQAWVFGEQVDVADSDAIPAQLRGYVQLALDLGLLRVNVSLEQGPFDLEPRVIATFAHDNSVTRAQLAMSLVQLHVQMEK
ncbi:S8 family serine peptidase [Aliiglaciecola litoralis]|uniref:SLH domain-containing protein n=1 Tax=Aliiglaciecola litoralis TaxID=582857 RepID=A0ABN1LD67_9ALTE